MFDTILHWFLTFVLLYKYPAIFVIEFVGSVGFPVPASAVLVSSSFFATQGYMNVGLVLLVGVVGCVAGDLFAFWLARKYGDKVLVKIGLGGLLRSAAVKRVEARIKRVPMTTVFLTRFTGSLSAIVNVVTGIAKTPIRSFVIADVIGEFGVVALCCTAGALFGDNWEYIQKLLGGVEVLVSAIIVLAIIILWKRITDGRRAKKEESSRTQ